MTPIISVSHLSKKYTLGGKEPYLTVRDTLTNFLAPHKKRITNDFWALKDVSFTISEGEVVGIIGRNGAGKSTLLKILSRITYPTTGEIKLRGSVASLLEVGTGFSPELTGRENIFLNGAILGMSRAEVKRKFEEIVTFAEVEKFIDTPVKYYSSGMYMRLAFAVAAHLEENILLVDEVLAVGDSQFQKKCLGKMEEVSQHQGRTILFVSHNMGAIQRLCPRTILLSSGRVEKIGPTAEIVSHYLSTELTKGALTFKKDLSKGAQITALSFSGKNSSQTFQLPMDQDYYINVEFTVRKRLKLSILCLEFYTNGQLFLLSSDADQKGEPRDYPPGKYRVTITLPKFLFNAGSYSLNISLQRPGIEFHDKVSNILFEIINTANQKSVIFGGQIPGFSAAILSYKTHKMT